MEWSVREGGSAGVRSGEVRVGRVSEALGEKNDAPALIICRVAGISAYALLPLLPLLRRRKLVPRIPSATTAISFQVLIGGPTPPPMKSLSDGLG